MTTDLERAEMLSGMGPVDWIVVEFPGSRMTGEAMPELAGLVDRGIIRILDLAFLRKEQDGTVTTLTRTDRERMQVLELALFDGVSSGLIGPDDIDELARELEPGSSAGILLYENLWAVPFAAALRRSGGRLAAGGSIPIQALVAAVESAPASG